jgi:hypothetical protein
VALQQLDAVAITLGVAFKRVCEGGVGWRCGLALPWFSIRPTPAWGLRAVSLEWRSN